MSFPDLTTDYLGLKLAHPFMPGASPLAEDLDSVRRLEDAGAAAIVLNSLFEERILQEQEATHRAMDLPAQSFAEALSYFPDPLGFELGAEHYLEQIRRIRAAVAVPVIASLNGTSEGEWLDVATSFEEAGATAIELNVYELSTRPNESASAIEDRLVDLVRHLRRLVDIPLAIKLSPFYTAPVHLARRLIEAGADGLVLFNRFYQPDIDPEALEVEPSLRLSDSSELLLRIRWLAVLSGQIEASFAVTGGVHSAVDAIKALMAGADAVQVVSLLLRHGPERLTQLRAEVATWLEEHEYGALSELKGSMNHSRCPDPGAFERANYLRILRGYRTQP
ncbi:MAG: dihydroorotate dehydrogenase-like protein [Thermoanaerobaculia bacterium]|nr:dihydroorotate dehydrogenase-like protein [Thermoanaerobaculia bacterium]